MSAAAAEARIGLERIDQFEEILKPDDAFELEAGSFVDSPDHVRFDPANNRQANRDAITAIQSVVTFRHETVRRQIDDMQKNIAALAMLANNRIVDRVPRRAAQIGYGKLCACTHDHSSPLLKS
jgi:hypothetical protein